MYKNKHPRGESLKAWNMSIQHGNPLYIMPDSLIEQAEFVYAEYTFHILITLTELNVKQDSDEQGSKCTTLEIMVKPQDSSADL